MKTAELFQGNPYLELWGGTVDGALNKSGPVTEHVQAIIKMAELYELRTANMLAYQDGAKRSTTKDFKDELRERVGSEKPTASSGSTFI